MKNKKAELVADQAPELLTPDQLKKLEEMLPPWVRELEADGTAVLRWNQEFLILVEEILRREFGLGEGDLAKLEGKIKEMLPELHKMSLEGLIILRPRDMAKALEIVEVNKHILKQERTGIALPYKSKFIEEPKKKK